MSKSVLISIKPKWCELIAKGKKTLEVRKTRPKLKTPFKVYIYCTQDGRRMTAEERVKSDYAYANGKVICEFVCDEIERVDIPYPAYQDKLDKRYIEQSCVPYKALHRYCYHDDAYFWHISNLKIYDKPRELVELGKERPPQSWCYVEQGG